MKEKNAFDDDAAAKVTHSLITCLRLASTKVILCHMELQNHN